MTDSPHHALVQAPVDPLDEDGLAAAVVGTAISLLATLIAWWQREWLAAHGQAWVLWSGFTAIGIGLLFIAYTSSRKRRRLATDRRSSTAITAPENLPRDVTGKRSDPVESVEQ